MVENMRFDDDDNANEVNNCLKKQAPTPYEAGILTLPELLQTALTDMTIMSKIAYR